MTDPTATRGDTRAAPDERHGMSENEAAAETVGHDMSRYWRLVSNDGGLVTGTWWVTREDRGMQHVKPIDVVMWSEGRRSGLVLHSEDFTAFVREGEVEPINVRARHSHVQAEAEARLDEIATAVLAVAIAPDWAATPTPPPTGPLVEPVAVAEAGGRS